MSWWQRRRKVCLTPQSVLTCSDMAPEINDALRRLRRDVHAEMYRELQRRLAEDPAPREV